MQLPGDTLPSTDQTRELIPVTNDDKRPVPHARRNVIGRTEGK